MLSAARARTGEEAGARVAAQADGRLALAGRWTTDQGAAVEAAAAEIAAAGAGRAVVVDLTHVERLDTLGAWVLERTRGEIEASGGRLGYAGARPEHRILLGEMGLREPEEPAGPRYGALYGLLDGLGRRVARGGHEIVTGIAFLGEVVAACGRVAARPRSFRTSAFVNQVEQVALHGAPIIILISFLVGGIVAQQGIFQLQRFGAQTFVVNLIGLLILRELGVLLT